MKAIAFIITIYMISLSSAVQAQKGPSKPGEGATPPVVTKGYYSIGKNAQKLNSHSSGIATEAGTAYPTVTKGYYSIGKNNRKLGKQISVGESSRETKPVIRKGYYSIGGNNKKLN